MRPLILALLLLLLAGCLTLGGLGGLSLIGGYRILDMPTARSPVGSAWRGGEAFGAGAPTDNIEVEKSFSAIELSQQSERELKLGLARLIDLEPRTDAMIAISVADVTIHSVRDPALLGLEDDQRYVHSAMKAGRLSIVVEAGYGVRLVAGLRLHGLDPSLDGVQSGRSSISVEGADLFFAYRLRKF